MRRFLVFVLAGLSAGCATLESPPIPVDALGEFRQSIEQLRIESDRALATERDLAYELFLERTKEKAGLDPRPFMLTFPGGRFDWQLGNDPAGQAEFTAIDDSRRQLNALHAVLFDYVDILIQLNSSGEPAAERIAASTEKLSGSVASLAEQLDKEVNERELGIFGTVANELTSQIVQRKRNAGLEEVMSDFHPGIVTLSDHMADAIGVSASGIKTSYQEQVRPIAVEMASAPEGDKQEILERLLALNTRTIEQLELLRELDSAYRALPGGHIKLMEALRAGTTVQLTSIVASINAIADIREALAREAAAGGEE